MFGKSCMSCMKNDFSPFIATWPLCLQNLACLVYHALLIKYSIWNSRYPHMVFNSSLIEKYLMRT